MTYDLRAHLKSLEDHRLLCQVHRAVDENWELSAVMRWVYLGYENEIRSGVSKFPAVSEEGHRDYLDKGGFGR